MSITNFKEQFTDRYQDTFHKTLVSRKIANYRLKAGLKRGDTVHRFALDMSGVLVRSITPLADRTIDPITNSDESLVIDQYKGTTFPVSEWEDTLHGNPDLGMLYGKEAAILVAEHTDATILSKVLDADLTFDTGNLTTIVASGTPIDLSTQANIPKMITRAPAQLANSNKVRGGNMVWVIDDFALADISQHVIGRDTQMGDRFYQNGASGNIFGTEVYVSDNLTGTVVYGISVQPTANDTVVFEGVTFTFVASPSVAGDVDLGADVDETRANLAAAFNAGAGAGTAYIELSAENRATLNQKRATAVNSNSADTLTVTAIGSGRITTSVAMTSGSNTVAKNYINAYFGKKGAIDVVIAKEVKMKIREEAKQDTVNIFNDIMYGVRMFADGAKKVLNVWIQA